MSKTFVRLFVSFTSSPIILPSPFEVMHAFHFASISTSHNTSYATNELWSKVKVYSKAEKGIPKAKEVMENVKAFKVKQINNSSQGI